MNESTPEAILTAARRLFAQRGFEGATVRSITAEAGANLGAVTYHFGSKDALHQAVLDQALTPLRVRLAETASGPGAPLDQIEAVLRAMFAHLAEHPDLPRLMLQQLATGDRLPGIVRQTMQANIGLIAGLIRKGQDQGSIRTGDPQHMALSVGGQPVFLALLRNALQQAVALDQDDPATHQQLVDSVVRFVRAGLTAHAENPS